MAIPDYQTIMLPLLRFLGDGVEHAKREAVMRDGHKYINNSMEVKGVKGDALKQLNNSMKGGCRIGICTIRCHAIYGRQLLILYFFIS